MRDEFTIHKNKGYYQVFHNGMLISSADTFHEAEKDIEEYNMMIQNYIDTGNLQSQLVAIFLR